MKRFHKLTLLSVFVLIIFFFTGFANTAKKQKTEINLEKKRIFNNNVSILVPAGFEIMSESMMKYKYPSERRPKLIYTNKAGSINVAFNHTKDKANQNILKNYIEFFEKTFKNVYPSADWIDIGMKEINGRKVGYQELITPAIDTKIYNLLFYTDLNERLLLCTFNCTIEEKENWQKTAHKIMNSLEILKK